MQTILFMVWWGRSTFTFIEEAYPPVVSTITSWSMQSCMKSADMESYTPSSTWNMELL